MSSGFDPVPSDRLEVTSEVGAALTDFDYRVMASMLKMTHALRWPKDTLSYLSERIALEGFQIPVSQLSGFTGFLAQAATPIIGGESTTSTTYANLATVGPEITGLPSGQYLLIGGVNVSFDSAGTALFSFQVNSDAVSDNDGMQMIGIAAFAPHVATFSLSRAVVKNLTAETNSVRIQYRVSFGLTAGFRYRSLVALKTADL